VRRAVNWFGRAMAETDDPDVRFFLLRIVFDRLYVLRNQLVHVGATWKSGVNHTQVRDRAAVLGWMLPVFIDIMMDHPDRDRGRPCYPVVA